ncbi:MAG: 16S rRNA (adenine(1518)-N(6)/adenine(1519)-N(6))-dimethyltransferase RsmA [Anaerolineae bacterium]
MSITANQAFPKIRELLKRYRITPSKGLGQNLLIDASVYERIVSAASLKPEDIVLEIGPGLGILTKLLARTAHSVVAVELDHRMVEVLHSELGQNEHVQIVEQDILQADIPDLLTRAVGVIPQEGYKVVANLPYYITSAALRHLLAAQPRPRLMVLMVQSEVADRLTASAGDLSLLAVSVQIYGSVEIVSRVPADSFYPVPKVDSAIVSFRAYAEPLIPEGQLARFFILAKAGFGQKRKQLHNSLAANTHLDHGQILDALTQAGIEPSRRAETLTLHEWRALCDAWPSD